MASIVVGNDAFGEWLTSGVQALTDAGCAKVCLCGMTSEGLVMTGYYACEPTEKAAFAAHINADVMLDVAKANAREIVEAAEENRG